VKQTSYSVSKPYLKNHKLHNFQQSLEKEKQIIERGEHLSVIHQLNVELESKFGLSIDYDSFEDNYGKDNLSQFKNKAGVDCTFDLVEFKSKVVKRKGFTIDYKFRDKNLYYDDFLAEIVSQDFGPYSNKMPVPGWAVCNHKINDAILYILPYHKKAALIMRKELKSGFEKNKFPMRNHKYAKNNGWTTISVPVSWDRLIKVCPSTIIFNYE
jgi:hypothetical protein